MLQEANPEGSQALEGLIHGYLGVRMHTYTEILFFFSFLSFYFFFFLVLQQHPSPCIMPSQFGLF